MRSRSPNYILKLKPNQFPAARLGDVKSLQQEAESMNEPDPGHGEDKEKFQQIREKFRADESSGANGSERPSRWGNC